MSVTMKNAIATLIGSLVVFGLTGCSTTPSAGHAEAVDNATRSWKQTRSELILRSAEGYFNTGDLERAESTLIEAVTVDPDNPRLHLLAGRVALERGQLERAMGRFQTTIDTAPDMPEPYYYMGIVLQRWERHEKALENYRKAYERRADSVAYLLAQGEMLVALDRIDDALTLLEGKLIYFDQSASMRVSLGQIYLMRDRHGDAVRMFREASVLRPEDAMIQEELIMAQMRAGEYGDAVVNLRRLLAREQYRDRRDLKHTLAQAYEQGGNTDQARAVYLELRRDDPQDVETWIKIGELAIADDQMTSALTAGQRVISLAPNRYEGYLISGMVWQKRGNAARALAMFDQAASRAPQRAEPMILRGITLQRQGDTGAAAKAYAEALRRQPDDARARNLLIALTSVSH
jgi:tetratricopeptide (TPR) repeat protein